MHNPPPDDNSAQPLLEPLTRREQEVLELLAEGLSSGEMAERLTLAVSSVRWYVQQIYGKLGVNGKRQAINRAVAVRLLPSGASNPIPIPIPEPIAPRPTSSLPTGTITFLFTDIEGSTPLWESQPKQMADAIRVHNAALRQAFEANGGWVFKMVGDSFQAAFATALHALKAAIEGQQALQEAQWNEMGPIKVRMGLHTGEAELDPGGDEYTVSHTKNRVARIMSAAHGGQVLLSRETADLVQRVLPAGASLKDMGEHSLKGLQQHEHLYQVVAPNLPQIFPSLLSEALHAHNLPLQLTPFIGRETEIKAVCEFLNDHRLVTVTGSGGVGKTRLSLQVAERMLERFKDGAWFVELAPLADSAHVSLAIVLALGLREVPGQSATQVLCEHLQSRRLLLVLDNCEHVVSAVAGLVDILLRACPHLHILATSREILGVAGETPFRCPSLALPDPDHLPGLPELAEYEAVRLFVERARTACPGFILTDQNAATIASLCQRLDGIPLAIELAAARLRLLSVEQILSRLDHAFRLLTGGSRTVLPRHQTLKALIDWSYNLLSEQERLLLLRLSVFEGGWTLEAAEAVCSDPQEGLIPVEEILELLSQLVDKSLVVTLQELPGATPRYRMLETIRQYAHDRLLEGGGGEAERERHLDYFLSLCLQAEDHLKGKDCRHWMERLEDEMDNLRLAMEWSLTGSIAKGLRLAAALFWFWNGSRYRIEGVDWLKRLLAAEVDNRSSESSQPDEKIGRMAARGKALNAAAYNNFRLGREEPEMLAEAVTIFSVLGDRYPNDLAFALYQTKQKDLREYLELARNIGDRWLMSEILGDLEWEARWKGDLAQMRSYSTEQLKLKREIEDEDGQGFPLAELGLVEFYQGNYSLALELFKAGQAGLKEAGNIVFSAYMLRFPAWLALAQGDYTQAVGYSEAQLAASQDVGLPLVTADALGMLGWEAWLLHKEDQAIRYCEDALKLSGRMSNDFLAVAHYVLGRVALVQREYDQAFIHLKEVLIHNTVSYLPVQLGIQAMGILTMVRQPEHARRAAILFGGQGSLHTYLTNVISPLEREAYRQALALTQQALGEEAFRAAWAEGQAMTTDQAVAYALKEEVANR